MKKQKNSLKKFIKTISKFSIFTKILILGFFSIWLSYWAWSIVKWLIQKDVSISPWAYNSTITFTNEPWKETYYVNSWNNSAIIWDYFKGYYYDSIFWYFKLDWSNEKNDNVRIIGSTDKCSTWYGYKFWGKAKSNNAWFIDFNYSNDKFVYYCLDDEKLYWEAYWKYIWIQKFDWIDVKIVDPDTIDQTIGNTNFVNDITNITDTNPPVTWIDSNKWFENIWWDTYQFDDTDESIFYIIK